MELSTAREILNVDENSSFKDVKRRYRILSKRFHPDNPDTGNNNKFLLISAAYNRLHGASIGVNAQEVSDDMEQAIDLRSSIEAYFEEIEESYDALSEKLQESLLSRIEDVIHSTTSFKELKRVIKKDIAHFYTDTVAQLKTHFKELRKKCENDNSDLLFKIFEDMYRERRRYWLINLYRNPVVVMDLIFLILSYIIKQFSSVKKLFPGFIEILDFWWFPLSILLFGLIVLVIQFILLNPRRQFLPPSFSLLSLKEILDRSVDKVDSNQNLSILYGSIGGVSGVLIGTAILPGIGTVIGGVIGALFGSSINDLSDTQYEINKKLSENVNRNFEVLDDTFCHWLNDSKGEITTAAFDSYRRNLENLSSKFLSEYVVRRMLSR